MGDLRGALGATLRLAGKVVWVTGAAGGIGHAVATLFRAEGATVFGTDLDDCDVSDRAAVDRTVARIVADAGRLDVLVHAAARLGGAGNFLDVSVADWAGFVATNLDGTFHVCQAAARAMGRGGAIVTIGSVNSLAAEPDASPYVASKGGVLQLTRAMAVDLAAHGIRANMVAPGPIEVTRNADLFATAPLLAMFDRAVPMRRAGRPEDVAFAALFLAEETSGFVTGTVVVVDGGVTAQTMRVV